jgi:hypothetical protein
MLNNDLCGRQASRPNLHSVPVVLPYLLLRRVRRSVGSSPPGLPGLAGTGSPVQDVENLFLFVTDAPAKPK